MVQCNKLAPKLGIGLRKSSNFRRVVGSDWLEYIYNV